MAEQKGEGSWWNRPEPARRHNWAIASALGLLTGQGVYAYTQQWRRLFYTTTLLLVVIACYCFVLYTRLIAGFESGSLGDDAVLTMVTEEVLKGTKDITVIAIINNLVCTADALLAIHLARRAL